MTTLNVTTETSPTTLHLSLHLELALSDLASGHASYAADREKRIAASPSPERRVPCPCELGGLWRGVPRARRRHAVLCALHPARA